MRTAPSAPSTISATAALVLVGATLLAPARPAAAAFFADDPRDLPDAQIDGTCDIPGAGTTTCDVGAFELQVDEMQP